MNQTVDIGNNLTSLLERLAQQIGTTADKVFPWYVQQAYLEGVTTLCAGALFLLFFSTIFALNFRKADVSDHNFNRYGFMCLVSGAFCFLTLMVMAVEGVEATRKIINPNYYAMKMLTQHIGNLTGK